MAFEKVEYKFPDEEENKKIEVESSSAVEIDISGKATKDEYAKAKDKVEDTANNNASEVDIEVVREALFILVLFYSCIVILVLFVLRFLICPCLLSSLCSRNILVLKLFIAGLALRSLFVCTLGLVLLSNLNGVFLELRLNTTRQARHKPVIPSWL